MPVIRLARLVKDLTSDPPAEGGPVRSTVLATDPAAAADIPAWCRMRGHRFVGAEPMAEHTAYVVELVTPTVRATAH